MKVPAGENSESPKACSSKNWILESGSESEYLFRVVVVVGGGGDDRVCGRSGDLGCTCTPPSRPNSSSSRRSSSDRKARDEENKRESVKSECNRDIVVFVVPHTHTQRVALGSVFSLLFFFFSFFLLFFVLVSYIGLRNPVLINCVRFKNRLTSGYALWFMVEYPYQTYHICLQLTVVGDLLYHPGYMW